MCKRVKSLFLFALALSTFVFLPSAPAMAKKYVRSAQESDEDSAQSRALFKQADTGPELRKKRRFGAGLQAVGPLGVGGAIIDLNFTPQWSFSAGFGGGEGFQAFMFQGRYVLAGDWFMPYFAFGFTNWSSFGKTGAITKSTPSYLADRLLNGDERAAGEFRKNLIYPSFGLQFLQLSGEWAGFSLFGEISALLDLSQFVAAPTGSLGVLYYF